MTPTLQVFTPSSTKQFAAVTESFLTAEPVRHSVILTRLAQALDDPSGAPGATWRAVQQVDPDGSVGPVVAVLMMTPPYPVYLSPACEPAARLLADHLWENAFRPGGEGGLGDAAYHFAHRWVERAGVPSPVVVWRTGILELDELRPPTAVPGRLRPAVAADLPVLRQWGTDFTEEARPGDPPHDHVTSRVRDGLLQVWERDGTPVSMAAVTRPQAGATRIQLVYTPKALRGNGYAGACVSALTAAQLAHPGRRCLLCTDLANPTSNALYERLGFRRIAEAVELRL